MKHTKTLVISFLLAVVLGTTVPALAQLTSEDIAALLEQAREGGWVFTVDENPATIYLFEELCGLREPENYRDSARFDLRTPTRDLLTA